MKNKKVGGALFSFDRKDREVFGFLVVGDDTYELIGIRRSDVRMDLSGRCLEKDVLDERSGDSQN